MKEHIFYGQLNQANRESLTPNAIGEARADNATSPHDQTL